MKGQTFEVKHYAESLRTMLTQGYSYKGYDFGKALAARCVWLAGEVVADVHGRAAAVRMLDRASDAINATAETSPVPEMSPIAGLVGVDGKPLPDIWTIPAPKTEADLKPLFEMIAGTFYTGRRLAEVQS